MKETKLISKERGITLIALVITIIILLILAGVTLRIALSENGLFRIATQSSETSKDVAEEERVKLAVSGAFIDGVGTLTKENVKKALESEFGELDDGQLEGADTGPWTFVGDRKTYTIESSGGIQELKPKTVADLKAGDWVLYKANGQDIYCRVLYDTEYNTKNSKNYGIQIISADCVENVTLGFDDPTADPNNIICDNKKSWDWALKFYKALDSYNKAVATLNSKAGEYIDESSNYVELARCVGSDPINPSSEGNWLTHTRWDDPCALENGKYRDVDENYLTDLTQLRSIKNGEILSSNSDYWFASRQKCDQYGGEEYGVRCYLTENNDIGDAEPYMIDVECDSEAGDTFTKGLRPVFRLKDGLKLKSGTGEDKDNAYILE